MMAEIKIMIKSKGVILNSYSTRKAFIRGFEGASISEIRHGKTKHLKIDIETKTGDAQTVFILDALGFQRLKQMINEAADEH
jgi:hypothetical protein